MKRSFVKKEIFEILEKVYSHPVGNAILAEDILCHLETLGMLPPRTKLGALGTEDNAWEPEDG